MESYDREQVSRTLNTMSVDNLGIDMFISALVKIDRSIRTSLAGEGAVIDADALLYELMMTLQNNFRADMSRFIESLIKITVMRDIEIDESENMPVIQFRRQDDGRMSTTEIMLANLRIDIDDYSPVGTTSSAVRTNATKYIASGIFEQYKVYADQKALGNTAAKRIVHSIHACLDDLYELSPAGFTASCRSFFTDSGPSVQRQINATVKNAIIPLIHSDRDVQEIFIRAFSDPSAVNPDLMGAVNAFLRRVSTQQIRPDLFLDDVILTYLVYSNVSRDQFDSVRTALQKRICALAGCESWDLFITYVESDSVRDLSTAEQVCNAILPIARNYDATEDEIAGTLYSVMCRIQNKNTQAYREELVKESVVGSSYENSAGAGKVMSLIAMDPAGTNCSAFMNGALQKLNFYNICRVATVFGNLHDMDELNELLMLYRRQKLYPLHGGFEFYIFLFIEIHECMSNPDCDFSMHFTRDEATKLLASLCKRIFSIDCEWGGTDSEKQELCNALNEQYGFSLKSYELGASLKHFQSQSK